MRHNARFASFAPWNDVAESRPATAPEYGVELIQLHRRLLCGDNHAREQIAAMLLVRLHALLRRGPQRPDPHLMNDAAEDALLDYLGKPDTYDLSRGVPLDRFLYVIAVRRLWNQLRSARRRATREHQFAQTIAQRGAHPHAEDRVAHQKSLRNVLASSTRSERRALLCWLRGRPQSDLELALEVTGLQLEERSQSVKRFKDRMRKRLRRELTRTSCSAEAEKRCTAEVASALAEVNTF